MFAPNYRITGPTAKALMAIEGTRQAVGGMPITAPLLDSLRRSAKHLSTHLSTRIEGNLLSAAQVRAVIEGEGQFPGRDRDEAEVRNYFLALEHVEEIGRLRSPLKESELRTIHGLVMTGRKKPTRYRSGQNVIREARSGRVVYLPPEAGDVPGLMKDLVRFANATFAAGDTPSPVIAALAHYQFATIHPYFDGNGRTARLMTNLLLHRSGYGLNGIYSLEEHYSENLLGYYRALAIGPSHNYYRGRAEADVSEFVEYFCVGMADAFNRVRARAEDEVRRGVHPDLGEALLELNPLQRRALGLFRRVPEATRNDVAKFFKFSPRRAYRLCARWLESEFVVIGNPSTKGRTYRLASRFAEMLRPKKKD